MNKQDVSKLFKGKGFYISLLTGILAIFAIGVLSLTMFPEDKDGNLTDLNEPSVDLAENLEEDVDDVEKPKVEQNNLLEEGTKGKEHGTVVEKPRKETKVVASQAENSIAETSRKNEVAREPETAPVMTMEGKISNLKFDEAAGLDWPLTGDVIMNYSMSNTIYFQTLAQYKCNPAIVIAAEPGEEVLCAADGVITEIVKDEETGLTVTTSIGDDYKAIYGQLKDVTAEVGDTIKKGGLLGLIEEPTKYYVIEGSNLYFKVEQNEESVNPLLLLK